MPRQQNGNGVYRTEPAAAESPSAAPPRPSRAKARAEPPAQPSEGDGFGVFSEGQNDVLAAIIAETQMIAERQTRDAIKAVREESEIEIGLVREELMSRMDSRLFGSSLVDDCGEIARQAVKALRVEMRRDVESMSTRLDDLRAEAKKREAEELSTWRAYASQTARNFAKARAAEDKLAVLTGKLDQLGDELRRLRHDLGDEGVRPWEPLALPAPT